MPCDGRVVSDVVIRTQGPSFGGVFARSSFLSALVNGVHVTTSPDVVRRFLLLERGKRCTSTLREDSERILRGQPFLAGASVATYDDGRGGVRVEVVTIDEISLVASGGSLAASPYVTGVRLGSSNMQGLGIYAAGEWRDGGFYRDGWRATAIDYQLLGRPFQLRCRWRAPAASVAAGRPSSATHSSPTCSASRGVRRRVEPRVLPVLTPGRAVARRCRSTRSFGDIGVVFRVVSRAD